MDERKIDAGKREDAGGEQQDATRSEQPSQVDTERADKHQRGVEGAIQPGAGVVAYAEVTPKVRHSQGKHAAGESDESGASHDAEDPDQRAFGHFRRDGGGSRTRELRWCWLDYGSCASHTVPVYCRVRTVAVTDSPGRSFLAELGCRRVRS